MGTSHHDGGAILLVEDHAATAEMVRLLLEDEGYSVDWVDTGRAVMDFFSQRPTDNHDACPDLMLMDLSLPDMDSIEMWENVLHVHKSVPPIILVSAKPVDIIQEAATRIGAKGAVRKPFDVEALLDAVRSVLAEPSRSGTG